MIDPSDLIWDLPPELAVGTYANVIKVETTGNDFILDFSVLVEKLPNKPRAVVVQRVRIPPSLVLDTIRALSDVLTKHEATHGEVPKPQGWFDELDK